MDDAGSSRTESKEDAGLDKPSEIKWSLPAGFTLGKEPSIMDSSLVGQMIYFRWKGYGWQLGKIYETVTRATPRLFKKFNYRIQWADKTQRGPHRLRWTIMHTVKMLPWTPGCCLCARKMDHRAPTRDRQWSGHR